MFFSQKKRKIEKGQVGVVDENSERHITKAEL